MTTLQMALRKWMALQPQHGKSCCAGSHFVTVSPMTVEPRRDDDVCPRERAWREYVRLRDGNRDFPFCKAN